MKKLFMLVALIAISVSKASADEGMWLLPFIKQLNHKQMKKQGLKLSAEDIYSANKSSIKDAIVIFGNGCTGEVISDKGLILTNHHCGFDAIQQHSSVEHDYLRDGFWAMTMEQEIPTPGLSVVFIKEIEDVTAKIIPNLADNLTEEQRLSAIDRLRKDVLESVASRVAKYPGAVAEVMPMLGGNQFVLFIKQEFTDIRMVGAPPSSIGKFGGDTDNWMWPRHTGDFSMFRIYSDANNNPAAYSASNKPLTPLKSLPISLKGVEENDFSMILGFPGSTQRYMTSYEIEERMNVSNVNRILVRGIRQDILLADMKADQHVRIQYASKYAQSSNYWKNSIGMNRGLENLKVKDSKKALEDEFTAWVNSNDARRAKYGKALPMIKEAVEKRRNSVESSLFLTETMFSGTELIGLGREMGQIVTVLRNDLSPSELKDITESVAVFYKDYNMTTDRKVAKAMFKVMLEKVAPNNIPKIFSELLPKFGGVDNLVDELYNTSVLATEERFRAFIANPSADVLASDLAVVIGASVFQKYRELSEQNPRAMFNEGHRIFIAGLQEMKNDKVFYPDANFTLRMTYGNVLPYEPLDGVIYKHYTTLSGVVAKYDPNNLYEFDVPARLKELYKNKDFGQYAEPGKDLVVGFLTNNDITGGNSGSPVINGKGELIGTAFDGNWEAMSGDIAFEPKLQRTICCDIRYVLFVVDKFAGCTRLIEEMKIVK